MKKEHVWFFVFVLAAAMVAGITMGIMLNFKYIAQQVVANQKLQEEKETYSRIQPSSSGLEVKIPSSHGETSPTTQPSTTTQSSNTQTSASANQQTSTGVSSSQSSSNTAGSQLMVVSPAEKKEIENMLNTVGIPANQDYNQRVRTFQETISLPATGIMDAQTLQALIQKTTVHQASRQLKR